MPIYSHQCECGESIVDNLYKSYDDCPDEYTDKCEACGKKNIKFKKVITAPSGFRLIGQGFYKPSTKMD